MLIWKETGGWTVWSFKVTTTVIRLGPVAAVPTLVTVPPAEVTLTGVVISQRRVKVDPPVGFATPQTVGVFTHPLLVCTIVVVTGEPLTICVWVS
jgi:hypothetical protein